MLRNIIKIALRNISGNKLYSAVNIAGLSVAVASVLLIVAYVGNELNYDRFLNESERVYRVSVFGEREGGHGMRLAASPAPLASVLKEELAEVEAATRISRFSTYTVDAGDERYSEEFVLYADSAFFRVFGTLLETGDAAEVLTSPNSVVITERMAEKYFGEGNPVGQALTFGSTVYTVTGVSRNVPDQSHLTYDFLLSMSSRPDHYNDRWFSNNYYTYVRLEEAGDIADVRASIPAVVRAHVGPLLPEVMGITYDEMVESGGQFGYRFTPVTDIYLHSDMEGELLPGGNVRYLYFMGGMGILILLIACINFINMTTAQSHSRAKEVAVRKVLGTGKTQLVTQFLAEAVFLSLLSVVAGLFLMELCLPYFQDITGKDLSGQLSLSLTTLLLLLAFGTGTGLLAGAYPSFVLSSFRPVNVLKGMSGGRSRSGFRSTLLVLQFSFSIFLILSTFIMERQLGFIQNKELGFEKEEVFVINNGYLLRENTAAFKEALRGNPHVLSVATTNSLPGKLSSDTHFRPLGTGHEDGFSMKFTTADYDYLETMGMEMAEGRYFSREFGADSAGIVLNEAAVRQAGWEDPIGRRITGMSFRGGEDVTFTVIGVVKNFHFESLQESISPYAMILNSGRGRVAVRLDGGAPMQETVAKLKASWDSYTGSAPFDFYFLDNSLDALYNRERRVSRVFGLFAGISIVVALLGLFSMATYTMEKNRKNIGIRKVLGADMGDILALFSLRFLRLILLAFLVTVPASYYLAGQWLQQYAYRIEPGLGIYLLTLGGIVLVSVIAIGYQAVRAATMNPVDSLRSE